MNDVDEASSVSGREALPGAQREAMDKAIRLEWISIAVLVVTVAFVFLVAGQSQAMRAAWIEDALSFLPPLAFLIAARVIRRGPSKKYPYGHHRSIGVAHLVAATALLVMGAFLIVESAMGLLMVEKPPIGLTVLFGHEVWAGWLMVAAMAVTGVVPVFLGRAKMTLAKTLHDKVLYADADMNKADWSTSLATIIGVLGIGVGLWWMDAVAAIVVALSILYDGVRNLRAAVQDLTDMRAMTFNEKDEPLIEKIENTARSAPWAAEAAARVRDQGHLFHVEVFVVPREGQDPNVAQLGDLQAALHDLDWKIHDVAVVPVSTIPKFHAR